MIKLSNIQFENEFVDNFPGDHSGDLRPRQTPEALYSLAAPSAVKEPGLLSWSEELAQELGIIKPNSKEEIDILGGNLVTNSMKPYAACYAGHQFGNWAGQLGDGRAITLGELRSASGSKFELQLKGAGPTAYSRRADGRAVLRSSVREYLMSEAMFHLHVPTTRALSLVRTGENVMRDMFYDGNPQFEPGAIVARVAPSFLRFGNFELLAAREEVENLRRLTNWTINQYYPHITGTDKIVQFYAEILARSIDMVVDWLRVGFVHGVMNTDNMSALGLSIDYGPYSFVDNYDLNFTPNTTDLPGKRYAFGKQPAIVKWNLGCLGGALAPLFEDTAALVKVLDGFDDLYWSRYFSMMGKKLGLDALRTDDFQLVRQFEKMLSLLSPDMTIFYRQLSELDPTEISDEQLLKHFETSFYAAPSTEQFDSFRDAILSYVDRVKSNKIERSIAVNIMKQNNPKFILRNYLLHQSIEEMQSGNDDLFRKLEKAMKSPYDDDNNEFYSLRPEWAGNKAGCSMLSCSS